MDQIPEANPQILTEEELLKVSQPENHVEAPKFLTEEEILKESQPNPLTEEDLLKNSQENQVISLNSENSAHQEKPIESMTGHEILEALTKALNYEEKPAGVPEIISPSPNASAEKADFQQSVVNEQSKPSEITSPLYEKMSPFEIVAPSPKKPERPSIFEEQRIPNSPPRMTTNLQESTQKLKTSMTLPPRQPTPQPNQNIGIEISGDAIFPAGENPKVNINGKKWCKYRSITDTAFGNALSVSPKIMAYSRYDKLRALIGATSKDICEPEKDYGFIDDVLLIDATIMVTTRDGKIIVHSIDEKKKSLVLGPMLVIPPEYNFTFIKIECLMKSQYMIGLASNGNVHFMHLGEVFSQSNPVNTWDPAFAQKSPVFGEGHAKSFAQNLETPERTQGPQDAVFAIGRDDGQVELRNFSKKESVKFQVAPNSGPSDVIRFVSLIGNNFLITGSGELNNIFTIWKYNQDLAVTKLQTVSIVRRHQTPMSCRASLDPSKKYLVVADEKAPSLFFIHLSSLENEDLCFDHITEFNSEQPTKSFQMQAIVEEGKNVFKLSLLVEQHLISYSVKEEIIYPKSVQPFLPKVPSTSQVAPKIPQQVEDQQQMIEQPQQLEDQNPMIEQPQKLEIPQPKIEQLPQQAEVQSPEQPRIEQSPQAQKSEIQSFPEQEIQNVQEIQPQTIAAEQKPEEHEKPHENAVKNYHISPNRKTPVFRKKNHQNDYIPAQEEKNNNIPEPINHQKEEIPQPKPKEEKEELKPKKIETKPKLAQEEQPKPSQKPKEVIQEPKEPEKKNISPAPIAPKKNKQVLKKTVFKEKEQPIEKPKEIIPQEVEKPVNSPKIPAAEIPEPAAPAQIAKPISNGIPPSSSAKPAENSAELLSKIEIMIKNTQKDHWKEVSAEMDRKMEKRDAEESKRIENLLTVLFEKLTEDYPKMFTEKFDELFSKKLIPTMRENIANSLKTVSDNMKGDVNTILTHISKMKNTVEKALPAGAPAISGSTASEKTEKEKAELSQENILKISESVNKRMKEFMENFEQSSKKMENTMKRAIEESSKAYYLKTVDLLTPILQSNQIASLETLSKKVQMLFAEKKHKEALNEILNRQEPNFTYAMLKQLSMKDIPKDLSQKSLLSLIVQLSFNVSNVEELPNVITWMKNLVPRLKPLDNDIVIIAQGQLANILEKINAIEVPTPTNEEESSSIETLIEDMEMLRLCLFGHLNKLQ